MNRIQVTLFSTTGKYKPISTLVRLSEGESVEKDKQAILKRGIENICPYRRTTWTQLKKDGYRQAKTRVYDVETIEQQKELSQRALMIKKMYEQRQKNKQINEE